jgi:hypothetical protein
VADSRTTSVFSSIAPLAETRKQEQQIARPDESILIEVAHRVAAGPVVM